MNRSVSVRPAPESRDERFLRRCLHLAARAAGRTRPNPMVGAVVVHRGGIVAEAYHTRAGARHAERAALARAGPAARGGTLYSNLEPCCHYGRTPPCVEAILRAGIRRIVVSHRDPDRRVNGRGLAALRKAGIRVDVGKLRAEAIRLNERYLTLRTRGRPFLLVKAAVTLDGRLATRNGSSRWITSPASRAEAHRLRSVFDAVLIGANTLRSDDPLLTVRRGSRPAGRAEQPVRVVLDGRLRADPEARLFHDRSGGPVLVYTIRTVPRARARRLEALGIDVVPVASSPGAPRRVSLEACIMDLGRRGVSSVMIEGGGEVIGSAFEARLVDKVALFMAPRIIGGREAVPFVGGKGALVMADAVVIEGLEARRLGPDLFLQGYVRRRRS